MSDINRLVLENDEKQSFLKKKGKKILLAGLAGLGAGVVGGAATGTGLGLGLVALNKYNKRKK